MNKIKLYILLFLSFSLLVNCSQKSNNNIVINEKTLPFNSVGKIELIAIPVDSKEFNYCDSRRFVFKIGFDRIICYQSGNFEFLLCDIEGNIIIKKGKKGKGPGEFSQIHSIFFDDNKKEICVVDQENERLTFFDLNANLINTAKIENNLKNCFNRSPYVIQNLKENKIFSFGQYLLYDKNKIKLSKMITLESNGKNIILKDSNFDIENYNPEKICNIDANVNINTENIICVESNLDMYRLSLFNNNGERIFVIRHDLERKKVESSRFCVVNEYIQRMKELKIKNNYNQELNFYRKGISDFSFDDKFIFVTSWDGKSTCIDVYDYKGNLKGKVRKPDGEWDFCKIYNKKIYEFYINDEKEKMLLNIYDFNYNKLN